MPIEVKVPQIGESIQEGVIARWLKKNGDLVRRDEPLLELETEKATTELPAPATGILTISIPEGKTVRVGSTVANIEEKNIPAAPAKTEAPKHTSAVAKLEPAKPAVATAADGRQVPPLSPAARVMVQEKGIDPRELSPSGRGGVVMKEDVLAHHAEKPAPAVVLPSTGGPPTPERETRVRMTAENDLPRLHVFTTPADMPPRRYSLSYAQNFGRFLGSLHRKHRVGANRHRGAGHDAHGLAGSHRSREWTARHG